MKRVGIYLRVSTDSQTTENQRLELEAVAARSNWEVVGFLDELHALKCNLYLHQQALDTSTPSGRAMFQMLGVFAEFERCMIRERVNAGLARAKAKGTKLGRRPVEPSVEVQIRK